MMKKRNIGVIRELKRNKFSYLFLLPAGIYTLLFSYFTIPYMIIAFEDFRYDKCIAYQIADVLELMEQEANVKVQELRVDGGPTKDAFLMQFQSDILDIPVAAPEREELSAMGAAFCAGIAVGVYSKEIFQTVRRSRFLPGMEAALRQKKKAGWKQAVNTLLTRPQA